MDFYLNNLKDELIFNFENDNDPEILFKKDYKKRGKKFMLLRQQTI